MTFLSLQEPLPVPECSKAFTLVSLSLFCRFLSEFSVQHILDPLVAFLVVSTFLQMIGYLNHLQLNVYNISVQHPLKTWSSYSGVSLIQRAWLNWPIWIVVWGWGMVAYTLIYSYLAQLYPDQPTLLASTLTFCFCLRSRLAWSYHVLFDFNPARVTIYTPLYLMNNGIRSWRGLCIFW